MSAFFEMVGSLWSNVVSTLNNVPVSIGGYTVSLWSVLFVLLVIGFVISVFWRGAKT